MILLRTTIMIVLVLLGLEGRLFADTGASMAGKEMPISMAGDCIVLRHGGKSLSISIMCPRFLLDGQWSGGQAVPENEVVKLDSEGSTTLRFSPIERQDGSLLEVSLHLQWSGHEGILRKWARYRLMRNTTDVLLEEVVLDELDRTRGAVLGNIQPVIHPPASYPILLDGFFVGIEHPVASTRAEEGRAILAHKPGIRLKPGEWHETRKAIYGIAEPGKEKETFRSYILAHCPGGLRRMFVWENWLSVPLYYTEEDHARMVRIIHDNLRTRHGVSIDAAVLTANWCKSKSVWEVDDARFPSGLSALRAADARLGIPTGFWISPCAFYAPWALDTTWLKEQGYETLTWGDGRRVACIGGKRYQSELKQRVIEMFGKYGMGYAYFDGFAPICPEADHGHEAGPLSAEMIADALIDVFQAVRKVQPDAWLEATCFGGNASPWWLFHVNTVLGNYGDDLPRGRIPAPVYRESQITARDFANLQGCYYSLIPIPLQEVFGGLYNHTPEPMVNDAVMGLMRGNMLYMIASDPRCLNDHGWAALAKLITWARNNVAPFADTQPLLPQSWWGGKCPMFSHTAEMPREPYGYAHWSARQGIVVLRNPWMLPASYTLELGETTQFPAGTTGISAVSLYPENRTYGRDLKYGDRLSVPLRPYETVVLGIEKRQLDGPLPNVSGDLPKAVSATVIRREVSRLEFSDDEQIMGDNWTALVGDAKSAVKLVAEARITLNAPIGELLILLEGEDQEVSPVCTLQVNGQDAPLTISGTSNVFAADSHQQWERWVFVRSRLQKGESRVNMEIISRTESPRISIWAWARKEGVVDGSIYPGSLPQPEEITLDAVEVLPSVDGSDPSLPTVKSPRPRMPVDGVFADTLDPKATDGHCVINTNVERKPLTIAGERFVRGIGTKAPSRIALTLDGKYSRFKCRAGVDDGGEVFYDKSLVMLEVWADGEKVWASGRMGRWTDATLVDVDVRGIRKLELVTLEEPDPREFSQRNHVGWVDAWLMR